MRKGIPYQLSKSSLLMRLLRSRGSPICVGTTTSIWRTETRLSACALLRDGDLGRMIKPISFIVGSGIGEIHSIPRRRQRLPSMMSLIIRGSIASSDGQNTVSGDDRHGAGSGHRRLVSRSTTITASTRSISPVKIPTLPNLGRTGDPVYGE